MSNGEHEIRTPKGLRIGNRSVVDGKNFVLNKEFLRKASELLKKHQWEMICRHYIEGMTHREIAAEMGVSHQYVTKGIKKGLHRIRCTYT